MASSLLIFSQNLISVDFIFIAEIQFFKSIALLFDAFTVILMSEHASAKYSPDLCSVLPDAHVSDDFPAPASVFHHHTYHETSAETIYNF